MQKKLNKLYEQYNRRQYVHPDPLEFLYTYKKGRDCEIVGLIASSLAYGRVAQILKSVSNVLERMGASPFDYLCRTSEKEISSHFEAFVHRFARGPNLSALLIAIKHVIADYGTLYNCFMDGLNSADETIIPALTKFSKRIIAASGDASPEHLLPSPDKGSACKRLNLYLRWMIRHDDVDPGGWQRISLSKLIVPLDTHMFQIAGKLGLTTRRQANLKTAIEITNGFKRWSPEDPVRYDFTLTRFGIRNDLGDHGLQ